MRSPFALLLLLVTPAALTAQSEWADFKPGTFAQVIQIERVNLDFTPSPDGSARTNITPVTWPQRVVVKYTGEHRPLSEGSQQVLRTWAFAIGHDSTFAARFTNEYLFRENGLEYWVPVQSALEHDLVAEYQPSERVALMTRWLGTFHRTGRPAWVFVANGFGPPPAIDPPPSQSELNGFLLGQYVGSIDTALGTPWRVFPHDDSAGSDRLYIIDRTHHAYMAFTFDSAPKGLVADLQLSGDSGTKAIPFLGLQLGATRAEVEAKFGPPDGERHEDDVNVDLLWWAGRNYTLEIDSTGRVNSIRLEGYEGLRDQVTDADSEPLPRLRAALAPGQIDLLITLLAPDIEFYQDSIVTRYSMAPRTELAAANSPVRSRLQKVAGMLGHRPDDSAVRVQEGAMGTAYKWRHGPVDELFFKWFPGGYRLWEVRFR